MRKSKHIANEAVSYMPQDPSSQKILCDRAQLLAKQINKVDSSTVNENAYIKFRLGDKEYYGVSYESMVEVMQNEVITIVPDTPSFVAGVVNYRGELISVIDLCHFFHIAPATKQHNYIIIVLVDEMKIGIRVDDLEGSFHYNPAALSAPLHFSGAIKPDYIQGLHQGRIAILQINQVMMDVRSQLNQ